MRRGAPPVVWALAVAFLAIEVTLYLSDIGILPRGMRGWAYRHFAFYAIVVRAAESGQQIPASYYWTFVTHAFLHGGFLHVVMNSAIFLALGAHLGRAVGSAVTVLIFLGSAVAGALGFALLTSESQQFVPMVGASGGIFGMLGAMKCWEWRHVSRLGLPKRRFWSTIIAFVAINVLLSVFSGLAGGGVAWEAHLGGFVAGWIAATVLTPRPGTWVGPI